MDKNRAKEISTLLDSNNELNNVDVKIKNFKSNIIYIERTESLQNKVDGLTNKQPKPLYSRIKNAIEGVFNTIKGIRTKNLLKKNKVLKTDKSRINGKKYFTIMFVPHSTGKMKTIRISRLYTKLIITTTLLTALSFYAIMLINTLSTENTSLKSSSGELYSLTRDQNILLNEKVSEISRLLDKENTVNIDIASFMDKYRNAIDKYLTGRIDSGLASRSEASLGNTLAKDIEELKDILNALSELNDLKNENFIDLNDVEANLRKYLDSIPDLWPVQGNVTSKFGKRSDPFTSKTSFHKGIDIAANYGVSIKASATGKVIFAGSYNELGQTVIIDHGNSIKTVYGHASKFLVKKGQVVNKGDIIANVGSSGRSTGSHLHFEIHINDVPIDPYKYLN